MKFYVDSRQKDSETFLTCIQAAIDAAAAAGDEACEIMIAPGVYKERLSITRSNLTIRGAGAENTVITSGLGGYEILSDGIKRGTFRTQTVFVHAHDVTIENLTIENTAGPGRIAGQAIALYADGDRLLFDSLRLLGHQDTLFCGPLPEKEVEPGGFRGPLEFAPRINGRQYYRNCLISGNIDFIFGSATAYFEQCEINCRDPRSDSAVQSNGQGHLTDSDVQSNGQGHPTGSDAQSNGQGHPTGTTVSDTGNENTPCSSSHSETLGYITAPSTPEGQTYGFVFADCRITSDCPPHTFYLGRPWREYGRSVFIRCRMDAHIKQEGWDDWEKEKAHDTAFFAEYDCTGSGADTSARASFARQLNAAEAVAFDREHVLGGGDGWAKEMISPNGK
ncbi:MAG: pectin methylesterase [Blautia sp.]|nr:pectin methylesterase [Blautia sp.]